MSRASQPTFYGDGPVPIPAKHLDSNKLKVAVQLDPELNALLPSAKPSDLNAKFLQLDQTQALTTFVTELCEKWGLEDNSDYGILFGEGHAYITEQNRKDLKHGSILVLSASPEKCVTVLLRDLQCREEEATRLAALKRIASRVTDPIFAEIFIAKKGLALLIDLIQAGQSQSTALHLHCFSELMEHGVVEWDSVQESFVISVASFVTGRGKLEDSETQTGALNILELLVQHSPILCPIVEREVPFETLIRHLENSSPSVQNNTLALMNSLFQKAEDPTRRKAIADVCDLCRGLPVRNALEKNVLKGGARVGTELSHQLGVLQKLLFNFYHSRACETFDTASDADREKLEELRRLVFVDNGSEAPLSPNSARKSNALARMRDFQRLGFLDSGNPSELFNTSPPGLLALDCMLHFGAKYHEECSRMILENSCRTDGHDCPLANVSSELVTLLSEALKISEPPLDQGQTYVEMFFKSGKPFEEFFVVALRVFRNTWRDMHARREDLSKVVTVVTEQVKRACAMHPKTMVQFMDEIGHFGYAEIQRIWQQDRFLREKVEFSAGPIRALREELKTEICGLVRSNRLSVLKRGFVFPKYSKTQRDKKVKYATWRLTANERFLLYEEGTEKKEPAELDEKSERSRTKDYLKAFQDEVLVPVSEVRAVVSGKECVPPKGRKEKVQALAFSIQLDDPEKTFIFLAPDENTLHLWEDGLNALIGNEMASPLAVSEIETLLSLEMKIRLLDLEGVHIPSEAPAIPPPPPDFLFAYDS